MMALSNLTNMRLDVLRGRTPVASLCDVQSRRRDNPDLSGSARAAMPRSADEHQDRRTGVLADTDMRFMRGTFVGADAVEYPGTFAFV
jgi:hypothetical protein